MSDTPRTDKEKRYAFLHNGMRSEEVVPVSLAYELERELASIKTEVADLKAEVARVTAENDPLAEMWRELDAYQPIADRDGHGDSWRIMCRERTQAAVEAARAADAIAAIRKAKKEAKR